MKKVLLSITKKLGYLLSAGIITVAVFVSLSYLLTPLLNQHRADFEKWASDLMQTPVTISQVEVSWYRYKPEISLNAVTILNKETKEPVLQIQKVRVFFSIPQSIWQRTFVPSGVMISGADINLRQSKSGEISVQGFPALGGFKNQPYQKETKITEMLGWFYLQPHLILNNINVRYAGFTGKERFVTLYKLSFQNSGTQHVLVGKALLHQEIPTEVNLALQWSGNSADLNKIKARMYVYVSGLSLGQWLKDYSWSHWQVTRGIGSAKMWATFRDGKFTKVQSTFQIYGLDLYSESDKRTHKITRISGNAGLKREGNSYTIAADDLLLDLPNHLWPVNSFYISLAPDFNANNTLQPKIVNLGYVDLEDAQSFLFSSSWLTAEQREALSKLKLKGTLQGINLLFNGAWNDYRHVSVTSNFNQLGFDAWKKFPALHSLSGKIKWDGSQGELLLDSHRAEIQYNAFFTHEISLDQVSGDAQFKVDENNEWTINVPSLRVLNNDTASNISGKLILPKDASPIVDLTANVTIQKITNIERYLPSKILDPDLNKWLKEAFLAGEIKSANLTLKGPMNEFPFDKGNGTFSVSGLLQNITLHFAPDWPDLEHIYGKINFTGRKMTIDIDQAETYNIPLGVVHAEIPDLSSEKQILTVQDDSIKVDLTQGLRFLHHSPLEESLGKQFADVELQGPATLKLGMTVPLNVPDKTEVQGDLDIQTARMSMPSWGLALTNLQGPLHFTETIAEASSIKGLLFEKPFDLSIATLQKTKETSVLRATLKTNLNLADLEHWLKVPFSKVAKGSTDTTIDVDMADKEPMAVHMTSNLVGVNIDLPDKYAKKADEARNFSADIYLPEKEPLRAKLTYGDLLSTALTLNRKKDAFTLLGVNLHVGSGEAAWPEGNGLYLSANFDELDWDKIASYTDQSSSTNDFAGLTLREIDVKANAFNVMGQRLTNVHLEAVPENKNWKVNIISDDIVGEIEAPTHFTAQGTIDAQFQKLKLRAFAKSNVAKFDLTNMPSVSIIADNVNYDDMPLGNVTVKMINEEDGINVEVIRIESPRMKLYATGWTQADDTHLRGNVQSTQLNSLLSSFGFNISNFVAKNATLTYELNWQNSIFSPSLNGLNGSAHLSIGPGRVVNVGEAGGAKMDLGRMLSIFSLQTIPRRLSLDFSDLSQKGYSFDTVLGDFNLQNGNAYTNNLRFNGPLAGVNINGRIGFDSKDYDLVISITPFVGTVTSGIPVAAAVVAGPVGYVAAFAVNTVLSPAVSKAAAYHYSVRGPWNNPRWMTVSGANR